MKLDHLLDRLTCPCCGGTLSRRGAELLCQQGHPFEVHGEVPILLEPEERQQLERDYGSATQMRGEYHPSVSARARKLIKGLIGSNFRLPPSHRLQELHDSLGDEWCLEVGSGVKNGSGQRVNLDIGLFPGVDVVGSGCRLPFADNSFALARNMAVLEHVRDPQRMIGEIHRVLRPGGHVYVEVPFLQHFHAYPNDFQRYTIEGLKQAFSDFEIIESGVGIGPSSALTALVGDYVELFTFSTKRWINDLVRTVPLILLWPLKFLDLILRKNPRAHEIASGIYLIGRKPDCATAGSSLVPGSPQAVDSGSEHRDVTVSEATP